MPASRSSRNRTLSCTPEELAAYGACLRRLEGAASAGELDDAIVHGDFFRVAPWLPVTWADLVILDPPYNLSKDYHGHRFAARRDYADWFLQVLTLLKPLLRPQATLYVCADWQTSLEIAPLLKANFHLRNRITWEREKGRGSRTNWKNNTEDIWFCTNAKEYHFDVDAVKLRRKVIAPYRHRDGQPKDWQEGSDGNFRLTHPSNLWSDLTVPFWSMPENTPHPTQKPEKLIARLVLASSREGDRVFDPFLGSGTTAAVCRKLNRRFCGVEQNEIYACWAAKRVALAAAQPAIQGYRNGVFLERNTTPPPEAESPPPARD